MKNSYKNVLVAVPPPAHEWYRHSADVLRKAASMLSLVPDVQLTFISIISAVDMVGNDFHMLTPTLQAELYRELRVEREKEVAGYVKWFTDNGVPFSIRIEQGERTIETLLNVVKETKPDLLLAGFHHSDGILGFIMPDFAGRMAKLAPCDVMLVAPGNE